MASGKYEKKQSQKTIRTYHKFEALPEEKGQQRKKSSKYMMKKSYKRKMLVLLAAIGTTAWISSVATKSTEPNISVQSADAVPLVASAQGYSLSPDSAKSTILYTIGIGNYGAEITIDNPQTPYEDSYSIYDSFIITSGNEAVTSDVNGNFLKGQISNEDYTAVAQMTEDEMANYNFYQVVSESGANVISDGNIISTIPNGDYVLASNSEASEKYVQALCLSNGGFYQGNIDKELLKEIGDFEAITYRAEQNVNNIENMAMVDTQNAKYINLKLREQPGQTIITEIPHGSFVQLSGETMRYGNSTWSHVKYQAPDGTEYQGWVDSENYLSSEIVQGKPSPKVREGINVNSTGNITGIDISGMSREDLNKLHENGISAQTVSVHGTFDTSQLEGENGFVGIKLGASAYSPGNLNILEYNNYMGQVSLCEQKGIPYIFYFYSTSITEEESLKEAEVIEARMNDLKKIYGLKHCLGVAVDKELAESTKPDRQRHGNVEEQTKSLAKLINEIQRRNLSNYVFIYAPSRVMQSDSDQIFDLRSLRPMLDNPENVALWLTSLMYKNGNMTQDLGEDIDYGKSCGFSTAITQVVLDAKIKNGEKYDINNMDFDWYKKLAGQLIDNSKLNEETSYAVELNNHDSSRQDGDELGI